jgi:hypothetical protein
MTKHLFAPGHKKHGGRTKGTPNKKTFDAAAIAEELEVDPLEVLLYACSNNWKALGYESEVRTRLVGENAVTEDAIPISIRIQAAKEAAQYLYPKRKAIEHSGSIDSKNITLEEFILQQSEKKNGKE